MWAKSLPKPPAVVQEIVSEKFYQTYDQTEINALWSSVLDCYGSQDRAVEAVQQQPFLLNPTYTWPPPLLTRTKAALLEVFEGDEEAVFEVMRKNPAVLQCGAPGILELGPDEITLFANVRNLGSRVPAELLSAAGITILVLILFTLGASRLEADAQAAVAPLVAIAKPLVGFVFALAIEGSRVAVFGSVVNTQMRKKKTDEVGQS